MTQTINNEIKIKLHILGVLLPMNKLGNWLIYLCHVLRFCSSLASISSGEASVIALISSVIEPVSLFWRLPCVAYDPTNVVGFYSTSALLAMQSAVLA